MWITLPTLPKQIPVTVYEELTYTDEIMEAINFHPDDVYITSKDGNVYLVTVVNND